MGPELASGTKDPVYQGTPSKTTIRGHCTPTGMAKMKRPSVGKGVVVGPGLSLAPGKNVK